MSKKTCPITLLDKYKMHLPPGQKAFAPGQNAFAPDPAGGGGAYSAPSWKALGQAKMNPPPFEILATGLVPV